MHCKLSSVGTNSALQCSGFGFWGCLGSSEFGLRFGRTFRTFNFRSHPRPSYVDVIRLGVRCSILVRVRFMKDLRFGTFGVRKFRVRSNTSANLICTIVLCIVLLLAKSATDNSPTVDNKTI